MKCIFILIFGLSCLVTKSQNLYIKLKGVNEKGDRIVHKFQTKNSFKDFKSLKEASDKILYNLQQEGYYNLRSKSFKALNDTTYLHKIKLNRKYSFIHLNNYDKYSDIFQDLDPYIKVVDLQNSIDLILNQLSQEGKPFSQIKLENIKFNQSDTIHADIVLSQSYKRKLDEIVLRGYDKFPKVFLKNYTGLKKGILFNRDQWIENAERLNALRFVNLSKTPQVQFTQDSTKLFLFLEKSQANSFDGFIGFNNSDDNTFQLNGNIDLSLVNNFNTGEEIQLNYKNDGNAQERFDARLRLPYLFKTRFSAEAGLGFFKQDSTFSNNTQDLKIDYQIGRPLNIGLTAAFESSTNLLELETNTDDIQDFDKSRYGIDAVYQTLKPYSSLFLSNQFLKISFGVGQRETMNDTETQQYISLEGRHIFKIDKRQYIYLGTNAGYLNSKRFIRNELYRFGGVNTMRGFAENRFFANLFGTLQTEYRYILGSNLYVHSVLDYGFYENSIDRFSENLYSFGVGFGLQTQAGVLRLIFANGGSDNQSLEFRNIQIHLKFISFF